METHELRLTMSLNEAGQCHLAIYATDVDGQWFLVEDWTCDTPAERSDALELVFADVHTWLTFAGEMLPA